MSSQMIILAEIWGLPLTFDKSIIYLAQRRAEATKLILTDIRYLYETLGLYKIPTTAPWTRTAKASGRR